MNYTQVIIQTPPEWTEILIAELGQLPFESFVEGNNKLEAYIPSSDFDEKALQEVLEAYEKQQKFEYEVKEIPKENWNEIWEKNFNPLLIADVCYVRASFHEPNTAVPYEIVIDPKMSFGTGHHETTSMVIEHQLNINHQQKTVLDVGCGTAILSIMAAKLGAKLVRGFDIDEWAVENSIENLALNQVANAEIKLGTIQDEKPFQYDIVLANINRNILIREIPIYKQFMAKNSVLIVSGFYEHDKEDIIEVTESVGLKLQKGLQKNQWASLLFEHQ